MVVLTTSVTNLHAGLTYVEGDYFTHYRSVQVALLSQSVDVIRVQYKSLIESNQSVIRERRTKYANSKSRGKEGEGGG